MKDGWSHNFSLYYYKYIYNYYIYIWKMMYKIYNQVYIIKNNNEFQINIVYFFKLGSFFN